MRKIPKGSNLIRSNYFVEDKKDGNDDKLKLKCRLAPNGNRDSYEEDIRKDSSTAEFHTIRLILSLFTILQFLIASLDVKIHTSMEAQ